MTSQVSRWRSLRARARSQVARHGACLFVLALGAGGLLPCTALPQGEPRLRIAFERTFEGEVYEPARGSVAGIPRIDAPPPAPTGDLARRKGLYESGFVTRDGAPATAKTEMWAAHDGKRLHLACRSYAVKKDKGWSAGESVTFCVDPNGNGTYVTATLTPAIPRPRVGAAGLAPGAFPRTDRTWQGAAHVDEGAGVWTAEASVELTEIGVFPGATIGVNVRRMGIAGVPVHQNEAYWRAGGRTGLVPSTFQRLTLKGSPVEVLEVYRGEMLPGDNALVLRLRNTSTTPVNLSAGASVVKAPPEASGTSGSGNPTGVKVALAAGEEKFVEAPYRVESPGVAHVAYAVALDGGARSGSLVEGEAPAPGAFFRVLREKVYPAVANPDGKTPLARAEKLQGYVRLDRSRASLRGCTLRVEVRDRQGGAAIDRQEARDLRSRGFVFEYDAAALKAGDYVASAMIEEPGKPPQALGEEPFSVQGPVSAARGRPVPLFVDNAVEGLAGEWQYEAGVLLPPNDLFSVETVRVVDKARKPLPTQAREVMRWRKDGPIKLMQVTFQAPAPGERVDVMSVVGAEANHRFAPFFLEYGTKVTPPPVEKAVVTRSDGDSIVVDTGALRATLGKRSGFFSKVEIDADGNGVYEPAESVLGDGADEGLTAVDQDGHTYIGRALEGDAGVVVETAGPVETVLRAQGHYVDKTGRRACEYRMRLRFTRGSRDVRIEHTWVMSEDANALQFRDLSIALPLAGFGAKRTATFHTPFDMSGAGTYSEEAGPRARVLMVQDLYNHHGRVGAHAGIYADADGRGEYQARRAFDRCGHWIDVRGARGGILAEIRDLWQQFPKELELDGDTLRVHLYSSRTVEQEQPARFGTRLLDFRDEAMVEWWGETFLRGGKKADPVPDWAWRHQSARGIARTHEVLLHWYGPGEPAAERRARGEEFQTPVLTIAEPGHNCAADPFDGPQPYAHPLQRDYERFMARFVEGQLWEDDRVGSYGFNEYGASPYFATENLTPRPNEMHYRAEDRLQPRTYRYTGHEYSLTTSLWWDYVRSGDRRYRTLTRRHVLHLLDRLIGHTEGDQRYGKYCDYACPYFWADGALEQWSFYMDAAQWLSAFGDLRWGGDVAAEVASVYKRRSTRRGWTNGAPLHNGTALRPWYGMWHEASSAYSRTWDLDLACLSAEIAAKLINDASPSGVMPGAGESAGKCAQTNVMLRPVLRYYSVCEKEDVLRTARKLCENYYRASYAMHGYTKDIAPYVWGTDYLLNKRRDTLAVARADLAAPYGRPFLGVPGLAELDGWPGEIELDFKGYQASVPFIMRAFAQGGEPGPFPEIGVEAAYGDATVYFDDPDGEGFSATLGVVSAAYPLRPNLPAGVDADEVPVVLTGPSGREATAAKWDRETIHYMGKKTYFVALTVPPGGEKGTYALTVRKVPWHSRVQFAVRTTTARRVVARADRAVNFGSGPVFFFVPKGVKTIDVDGLWPRFVRDPLGRGAPQGAQGMAVPPGLDNSLWSATQVNALDCRNVPPVVAFHTPQRFFIPTGIQTTAGARDEASRAKETFCPGRFGQGLHIAGRDRFSVALAGVDKVKPSAEGTVEFWHRPDRSGLRGNTFFRAFRGEAGLFGFWTREQWLGLEGRQGKRDWPIYPYYGSEHYVSTGEWHHVALCWDLNRNWAAVYVDGAGDAVAPDWVKKEWKPADLAGLFDRIDLFSLPEAYALGATVDELRVSTVARYPGGFTPADKPFALDGSTLILMHVDGDVTSPGGIAGVAAKASFTPARE